MIDATIHLDDFPETEVVVLARADGPVKIQFVERGVVRATIFAKPDKALEIAELIEFTLLPSPMVQL